MWLGQTHPKGVFWYSVVESIILFNSMDEMLVMAHGVIKATALCKEPMRLHMTPPSTTHVRACIVVRDGEPSGAQPPAPDREEEPQPSPSNPTQEGGPHINFRWTLGMPS